MYSRIPSLTGIVHMHMHCCSNIASTVAKRGFNPIHANDILGPTHRIITQQFQHRFARRLIFSFNLQLDLAYHAIAQRGKQTESSAAFCA